MITMKVAGPLYASDVKKEMIKALRNFTQNEERVYIGKCFLMIQRIIEDKKDQKTKNSSFLIMKYQNYSTKCLELIVGGGWGSLFQHKWRLTTGEPERYDFGSKLYKAITYLGKISLIVLSAASLILLQTYSAITFGSSVLAITDGGLNMETGLEALQLGMDARDIYQRQKTINNMITYEPQITQNNNNYQNQVQNVTKPHNQEIEFIGQVRYEFLANQQVRVEFDQIQNNDNGKSGTILIKIAACDYFYGLSDNEYKYESYYTLAEFKLDSLDKGYHYSDITRTLKYSRPRSGKYKILFQAYQYKQGEYVIQDTRVFSGPLNF